MVTVFVICPGPFTGAPVAENRVLFASGGPKFAWFIRLNISGRNWILNASEIAGTWKFLIMDASKFCKPGPKIGLRPALPRLVAVLGKAKHDVLM